MRLVVAAEEVIVNVLAAEVVMSAFNTLTDTDPALAIIASVTGAVTLVALTNVVVNWVEFQTTFAPDAKPVPFPVRVNAAPPAMAEVGLRLVIAADGVGQAC